jgi:hypothetical protein
VSSATVTEESSAAENYRAVMTERKSQSCLPPPLLRHPMLPTLLLRALHLSRLAELERAIRECRESATRHSLATLTPSKLRQVRHEQVGLLPLLP